MPKYDVFELVTHLRKCPVIFFKSSDFIKKTGLDSMALISDSHRLVSNDFLRNDFGFPNDVDLKALDENHWNAIHISTWLLNHEDFINNPKVAAKLNLFWFESLYFVVEYVNYKRWVEDEERAEEMVRMLLMNCEVIPNGETMDEASDKFLSVSSIDRHKVLKESYNAHKRVMDIQKEMAAKKAREAANAYGRE